jgi:hypothetical protein
VDVRWQHFFRVPVGVLVAKVDELAQTAKSTCAKAASPAKRITRA